VAVHPDLFRTRARHDFHEPGIVALFFDARQIVVEEVPRLRREELAKVPADAVLRLIVERVGGRWIDRQDVPGEIVRADQTETVLDQLAISPLAVVERGSRFLPCCDDGVERRRATIVLRHPSRGRWRSYFRVPSHVLIVSGTDADSMVRGGNCPPNK